jgi:hypothetical protein
MSVYADALLGDIVRRLGDPNGMIWDSEEIRNYIDDGYRELTRRTGCLWAMECLPDEAAGFTVTAEWEREYVEAGEVFLGVANFTSEFERDYVDNGVGPANFTSPFEANDGHQTTLYPRAVVDLPDDFLEIERATWNTIRIEALNSRFFEERDSRYEITRGEVTAYTQDKDGLNRLRKWRVPSTAHTFYELDDDEEVWGILVDVSDVDDSSPSGMWGDFCSIAGEEYVGGDPFGIVCGIYRDRNNVRLEYRRRGAGLSAMQPFEIPDRYTTYVRHYVMARALEREGPGHEPDLSAFYDQRYEEGVAHMLERGKAMAFQESVVLGSGFRRDADAELGLARLPWAYGQVMRR